jgi:predicted ATPase/DNA-binding SARP family transcriptional activator/Tfp pilus assembly protein PilF
MLLSALSLYKQTGSIYNIVMESQFIWRLELLGRLQAQRNDLEVITRFPTQRTAVLLAYLGCHPLRQHAREELIDMLWPEADLAAGRLRLRVALNALRRRLEPPSVAPSSVLYADAHWVYLQPGAVATDVIDFENLLSQAEQENAVTAKVAHLTRAVALYRGELLPGYYDEWIQTARIHLEEAWLDALEMLALACETQGDCAQAGEWARRALAADPLREACHLLLMRLHARQGNMALALRQFDELEAALQTIQATPGPAPRALQAQIRSAGYGGPLMGDVPSLPAPPPVAPPPPDASVQLPLEAERDRRLGSLSLPARLTRFYGRKDEIAQIAARLLDRDTRLVTLTGIGGAGKTRLSLEVARKLADSFTVLCFVSLMDLTDRSRLPDVIAQSLGLKLRPDDASLTQIVALLEGQAALLILDNFEHLLPEGADTALLLLERLPQLTLLVTSRQSLDLSGEYEFPVPPFDGPSTLNIDPAEALRFPDVGLFVDRAQMANPGFQITPRNVSATIALCRKLDGIPLAIELAGSWAGTLTPAQMLIRLNRRFDFLVNRRRDMPARHQTLKAAIHWSYDSLAPELRRFFVYLSVFRGGWTLEAAEAICRESEAAPYLRLLRQQALIVTIDRPPQHETSYGDTSLRFRMLETLREFAAEQLSCDDQETLCERHARWFLARLQQGDLDIQEQENYRAAHDWARAQPEHTELYLQLVSELARFWRTRGWWPEGLACLKAALTRDGSDCPVLYGHILRSTASMSRMLGDYDGAMRTYQQAHDLLTEIGDDRGMTDVLNGLGCTALNLLQYEAAQGYLHRSLLLAQRNRDDAMAATIHGNLGFVAMEQRQWQTAQEHMQQCLSIHQKNGMSVAWPLQNLAELAQAKQQWAEARALYEESLALYRDQGEIYRIAEVLGNLAVVLEHCGETEEAERYRTESQVLTVQLRGA